MTAPFDLRITGEHFDRLHSHLFPGDRDEHGAVVFAGVHWASAGLRLLVRDVVLARDGVDYVSGTRGYRALDPVFIAKQARRARDEGWVYLAAHNHGGSEHVGFSTIDMSSHERGYPALNQITSRPVGGLVLADRAIAGDLWLPDGSRAVLREAVVLSTNVVRRYPAPPKDDTTADPAFDRQARFLGDRGQELLQRQHVVVVGAGGAGSMAVEMLARLGVGRITVIDPDRLELHNVPRLIGSRMGDLATVSRTRWWRRANPSMPPLKVEIAERLVHDSGLPTQIVGLPVDVMDPSCTEVLRAADWIVLAADSASARFRINAVAHAYLIPVSQVGVKIPVNADGVVGEVFCASRLVLPHSGCLWCNGLIDATALQLEAMDPEEARRARAYVGADAPAPSVVTLNGVSVSSALTDMMLRLTGLHTGDVGYQRWLPRRQRVYVDEPRRDEDCLHCGRLSDSLFARGDDATLPVRSI